MLTPGTGDAGGGGCGAFRPQIVVNVKGRVYLISVVIGNTFPAVGNLTFH